MNMTAQNIADLVQGTVEGCADVAIFAPNKLEDATEGHLSFLSHPKYESQVYNTKASILIVGNEQKFSKSLSQTLIRVKDPYDAFNKVLKLYTNTHDSTGRQISENCFVGKEVSLGNNVKIDNFCHIGDYAVLGNHVTIYPNVTIGVGVTIGEGSIIYPGVVIYKDCKIGSNCIIHANAVIGSDGFGFVPQTDGTFDKIPQIGNVVIEDQVEIGANTVIDRATMGQTIIKKGAKLDNLIQIAHNVSIGEHTMIAAQTGIAGSSTVGDGCLIGGQVGIVGHIKIADKTMIQAKSGVSSNVSEKGKKLYGYPAIEYQKYLKSYAYFKNLDQMVDKIRNLEKELDILKQEISQKPR
jgi:UDP-3-O-[3-hydroxymyristoyl] glucosamine N-acyltransferase